MSTAHWYRLVILDESFTWKWRESFLRYPFYREENHWNSDMLKIIRPILIYIVYQKSYNQFLTQKNGKHFIDISIVSKGEDFL